MKKHVNELKKGEKRTMTDREKRTMTDREKQIEELRTLLFEKSNSANVEPVFTDENGEEHYLPDGAIKVLNDILEKAFIPFLAEVIINNDYRKMDEVTLSNQEELLERAEELAEEKLCSVKCLCPDLKEAGLCSGCEVFLALRDYYIQQIEEGEKE